MQKIRSIWQRVREFLSPKNSKYPIVDFYAVVYIAVMMINLDRLSSSSDIINYILSDLALVFMVYIIIRIGLFVGYLFTGKERASIQQLVMSFGKKSPLIVASLTETSLDRRQGAKSKRQPEAEVIKRSRVSDGAFILRTIAIFSLISTVITMLLPGVSFTIGTTISMVVDTIGVVYREYGFNELLVSVIVALVSILVSLVYLLLGRGVRRGKRVFLRIAFWLYLVDTLLLFFFEAYIAIIFHIYFLYQLTQALRYFEDPKKFLVVKDPGKLQQKLSVVVKKVAFWKKRDNKEAK